MSWRTHADHLLSKLSSACYAVRVLKPFMSPNNFRLIHLSYIHSMITYGIMFWGISPHSKSVFKSQKVIRSISIWDSCREKFRELKILPLHSQYIFSLLLFVVKNKVLFKSNSDIHSLFIRYKTNLYPPLLHLKRKESRYLIIYLKIWRICCMVLKNLKKNMKKISPCRFILYTWRIFFLGSIIDLGTT